MRTGMIFPGYGSQFVGMCKDLYDEFRIVQEFFEEAANCTDENFVKLCFASSDVELNRIYNAYKSILIVSSAIAALLKSEGIVPHMVSGYGIGSYAAAVAAGGVSFPDALYLLSKYAKFYDEFADEKKYSIGRVVGVDEEALARICEECSSSDDKVKIVAKDTDRVFVISGHSGPVQCVHEAVIPDKANDFVDLDLGFGLHSPLVTRIVTDLEPYAEKVDFNDPNIEFIDSASADRINSGAALKDVLLRDITRRIMWREAVDKFSDCDIIIEVGPGRWLSETVREAFIDKPVLFHVKAVGDIKAIKEFVLGSACDEE